MDYLERLEATHREIKYLSQINTLLNDYNKSINENVRFRKFLIEYFDLVKTDAEKERFVLLLEEFGVLDWEKYGVKGHGNKERIID
jgi:hypothetical protein